MYKEMSIPNYQVESLLLLKFSQLQFLNVSRIMSILGDYMLLDTSMLYKIYFDRYSEKLGLSFVKLAVREKLLAQFKFCHKTEFEKEIYFYSLQKSAFHALDCGGRRYNKLPFFSFQAEKSRVITANQYFLEHNYVPNISFPFPLPGRLNFFYATNSRKQNLICYYADLASPDDILSYFKKFKKDIDINLIFEVIDLDIIDFGAHTRATHPNVSASLS